MAAKYNKAPETRSSTNLIVPFRSHTWEMQRGRLAEISLVNIIALFEMWCDDICELFGKPDLAIKLQHPTNNRATNGIGFALRNLQAAGSSIIANSIQPVLRQSKKYSLSTLESLFKCYRYFKEIRNCIMHRGRKCDGKLWGAQSAFIPIATDAALGMDFVPEHMIVNQGDEVKLSLHGIMGFTDVILRIAITVDAVLAATPEGEQAIVDRIFERTHVPAKSDKLPNLFTTIGWPGAILTTDLLIFLKGSGIIA